MANFPTSKDDGTSLPNPQATDKQNSPDHASLHTATNSAVIAVETKVGTGASTPASNTLLFGTGAGTSAWQTLTSSQLAATLSDETGTGSVVFANTPTLITPKVDTINENTLNNGVTVGGVNLKSGALNTNNSVVTANIANAAVTANKLSTGAAAAFVATNETTTSTTYADLTTTTDSVTTTIGANGLALVSLKSDVANTVSVAFCFISVAISGATTTAAADSNGVLWQDFTANGNGTASAVYLLTGLTAGSTTFKMKYRVQTGGGGAGTGTFTNRRIAVVPL